MILARLEKPTQLLPEVIQPVTIRPLVPADGAVAAEVFFDAVHGGAADVFILLSNAKHGQVMRLIPPLGSAGFKV